MRKPAFCIWENKGADQLPMAPAQLISTLVFLIQSKSVAVQSGLCQTWSDTLKTGFVMMCFIC